MNFTFLWCNEAMGGQFGAPKLWQFSFFWVSEGEIWTVFWIFSLRWKDWRFLPISTARNGERLWRRWRKKWSTPPKEVKQATAPPAQRRGWYLHGWMDGIDHQDSCASCRFHVLMVGSLQSQYSSTVRWRYFKEMVLSFGMDLRRYFNQKQSVLSSDVFQLQPFWKALRHLSHLSQDHSFWSTTNFPFPNWTLRQFFLAGDDGLSGLVKNIDAEDEGEDDSTARMEFVSKKKCGQQTTISILNIWKLRPPQKFAFMFHKSLILGIWKQSLFIKQFLFLKNLQHWTFFPKSVELRIHWWMIPSCSSSRGAWHLFTGKKHLKKGGQIHWKLDGLWLVVLIVFTLSKDFSVL